MKFVCTCCFCGRAVKKSKTDPCMLYIEARKSDGQSFWPHAKCFRRVLHKAFRDDLMEELGGPELKIDWSKAVRAKPGEKIFDTLRRLKKKRKI